MRNALNLTFTTLVLAGCTAVDPAQSSVDISVTEGFQHGKVEVTVQNVSATMIYVAHCGDRMLAGLEREQSGEWVPVATADCGAKAQPPARLSTGQAIIDNVVVGKPGLYRVRVAVSADSFHTDNQFAVSPSFEIR